MGMIWMVVVIHRDCMDCIVDDRSGVSVVDMNSRVVVVDYGMDCCRMRQRVRGTLKLLDMGR